MADVAIETTITFLWSFAQRAGPFWTSPLIGYVVYLNVGDDLEYRKTVDGGATWGAAVNIRTGDIQSYDCWADWQTAGDAGTKIHIAYTDSNSDDVRYVYLDTSDDSVGGDVQIEAARGNGALSFGTTRVHHISITKTRGGNLAVALRYRDTDIPPASFYSFYTSPDATTWNSKASPWENVNTESVKDFILLFPGNEADTQDVWATFWDIDADEISLKTYDDSGDSWLEQSISLNMADSPNYLQMDGQIRLSDGHLIFAAWTLWDNAASDLMVWDINGAGSIIAKTNVITNEAETFAVSVFVNQVNDDIYVAYFSGTSAQATVKAFYQKSDDGGDTWGGEKPLQADAEDDMRWISAGAMRKDWGGKFQPYWYDHDDTDLFTNTDNGIRITLPPTIKPSANMAAKMVAAGLI